MRFLIYSARFIVNVGILKSVMFDHGSVSTFMQDGSLANPSYATGADDDGSLEPYNRWFTYGRKD